MELRKSLLQLTAVAGLALVPTLSMASTFDVLVGYADNLRPTGFFPTTWLGDPGVQSQSSAAQLFDSAAVRIDNTAAATLHITNFAVTMNGGSGPTYAIWNALDILAGGIGIFTQTFSYNFDASDNSPFGTPPPGLDALAAGSNGIGGCSSTAALIGTVAGYAALCDANRPIVSFDANGIHFAFDDKGHILDTGYYDFVNNNVDGNESINWNKIGSGAHRDGTSPVPLPASLPLMLIGLAGLGLAKRRKG